MSVVVLTGWAGQVSLGQMSFVGFGAAVGAYATQTLAPRPRLIAMLLAGLVGASWPWSSASPRCALRGLFLAVTTLAFAMATSAYFLNVAALLVGARSRAPSITRPKLFGVIDLTSQTHLLLLLPGRAGPGRAGRAGHPPQPHRTGAAGAARERAGRAVLRRQHHPGQADRLRHLRVPGRGGRLPAGAPARPASARTPTRPTRASCVFIAAVVGGLGSLLGALLGASSCRAAQWFLPGPKWQALVSAGGVLLVLMDHPRRPRPTSSTGSATPALRWVAERRGIVVPSLVADVRQDPTRIRIRSSRPRQSVEVQRGARWPTTSWPCALATAASNGSADGPDARRPTRSRPREPRSDPDRARWSSTPRPWHERFRVAVRHPITWLTDISGGGPVYALAILFGLNDGRRDGPRRRSVC